MRTCGQGQLGLRLHLVEGWTSPALQLLCTALQAGRDPSRAPESFHDLRYSYAAMLIAEGAHPRAIMKRLGHSTIQVTLGTYGHLFPNAAEGSHSVGRTRG